MRCLSKTWGWIRPPRSACCCSASPRYAAGCGWARSPRWTSGSRPYTIPGLERTRREYMQHHLALAGRSDTLFSDDAVALIHQVSRGLPRLVNNLAVAVADRRVRCQQGDRRRVRRPRRGRRSLRRMTLSLFDAARGPAGRQRRSGARRAGRRRRTPPPTRPARRDRQHARAAHRGRPRRDPHPAARRLRRRRRPRRLVPVEATRHHPNEFMILVGDSAKARRARPGTTSAAARHRRPLDSRGP